MNSPLPASKQGSLTLLKRSAQFIRPFFGLLALATVLNTLFAVFNAASIAIIQLVFQVLFKKDIAGTSTGVQLSFLDRIKESFYSTMTALVTAPTPESTLINLSFLIIGLFVIKNIVKYTGSIVNVRLDEGIAKNVRDTVFTKLTSLSVDFFSRNKGGALMSLITNDIGVLNASTITSLTTFLREGIQIVLFLMLLISLSPHLTLIAFSTSIISLILISAATKYLKRYAARMQDALADYTSALQETIIGIRIVKAYNAEKSVVKRFMGQTAYFIYSAVKHEKVIALVPAVNEVFAIVALCAVFFVGGMEVFRGTLQGDELMTFLFALFSIMSPISTVVSTISRLQRGFVAAERVFGIIDEEPSVKSGSDTLSTFEHSLEVHGLTFAYAERPVVRNVSFAIPKNKKIALVGSSGSGKSTMLDLLIRFYDPQQGAILVDRKDIRSFSTESYRSLFGIVAQEAMLFNDTIANNIRFGLEDIPMEDIVAAAKIAHAHDFISALPKGYDTPIGDRGVLLSGGQRQRVAIARALARNPHILIFDEATSALDSESEKVVQEAITEVLQERTAVIVAHRLSTIIGCDEILVFDEGRIVERGTHQELINMQGVYKRLYDIQFAQQLLHLEEKEVEKV